MAFLATICLDKSVRVWCAQTFELLGTLSGHTDEILCVCFSSDATKIATASDDSTVRIWETATMMESLRLEQNSYVSSVCFSVSGDRIAFRVEMDSLVVWDLIAAHVLLTIAVDSFVTASLGFINNDDMIIGASAPGEIAVWDLCSGKELQCFMVDPPHHCSEFSVSPTWNIVAIASSDCKIYLWCAISVVNTRVLTGHRMPACGLCFQSDGSKIASCSHDRLVFLWDVSSGSKLCRVEVDYGCFSLSFSLDGTRVACGTENNDVVIYEVEHADNGLAECFTFGSKIGLNRSLCFSQEAFVLM
jgi:WD40 repeat protein